MHTIAAYYINIEQNLKYYIKFHFLKITIKLKIGQRELLFFLNTGRHTENDNLIIRIKSS